MDRRRAHMVALHHVQEVVHLLFHQEGLRQGSLVDSGSVLYLAESSIGFGSRVRVLDWDACSRGWALVVHGEGSWATGIGFAAGIRRQEIDVVVGS